MQELQRIRGWDENHTRALVETMLYEALKGTDYDYYCDYKCLPSKHCKFHGTVDFMIYKKTGDHLPLIPVLIAKKRSNVISLNKIGEFSACEAAGAAAWSLANMQGINKEMTHTRVLQTTGHTWMMYEFSRDGQFRRTGAFIPESACQFKKIYDDLEMQEMVLGFSALR